jgi:hypothetical protein
VDTWIALLGWFRGFAQFTEMGRPFTISAWIHIHTCKHENENENEDRFRAVRATTRRQALTVREVPLLNAYIVQLTSSKFGHFSRSELDKSAPLGPSNVEGGDIPIRIDDFSVGQKTHT